MEIPRLELYQDKHVLVTGGNGFLGRYLPPILGELGATVLCPTRKEMNLLDRTSIVKYIRAHHFDLVIHLAAVVSGIVENRAKPFTHLEENIQINLNLLYALRHYNVPIVAAGSVCGYPQNTPMPMIEENFWNGKPEITNFGYGESKRLLLAGLECLHIEHHTRYVYLNSANLYGPGDKLGLRGHVIANLIEKFSEARAQEMVHGTPQVTVWGDGSPTRDFLYAQDAARAYVYAGAYLLDYNDSMMCNIGSGIETSIADLARIIADIYKYKGRISFDASKPNGQPRRNLDVSWANQALHWQPEVNLHEGLKNTINWYERSVVNGRG